MIVVISNASGGSGMVDSVTAGDLSIVVGGTVRASAQAQATGTTQAPGTDTAGGRG
jgi:hypothetical protein